MNNIKRFSSRKEVTEFLKEKEIDTSNWSEEKWLSLNKGQAEIHMMMLSEKIYDVIQESVPIQLKPNEWHIPMISDLDWLQNNEGNAEIHIMMLSEAIYDAIQESNPKVLQEGDWHIPMIQVIED